MSAPIIISSRTLIQDYFMGVLALKNCFTVAPIVIASRPPEAAEWLRVVGRLAIYRS
jgi:hypothetical protein